MYTLNNKPVLEENDQVIIEWEHLRYPDKEVQDFIDANGYHDETLFTVTKFDNESGLVWLKEIPTKLSNFIILSSNTLMTVSGIV